MRKIGLIVALVVSGLGSAYANDVPVPSFNDNPQLYSHAQSSTGASAGSQGTWSGNIHTDPGGSPDNPAASHTRETMNRSAAAVPGAMAPMNQGPWSVTPSSGP